MKTLLRIVAVGIVLGAILFGITRGYYDTPKDAEGFIMAAVVILILLSAFLAWSRPYVLPTNQTAHRVDTVSQQRDVSDFRERASLSIYGYSFAVAAVVLLILDAFIR